jgi:flavodoxin
MTAKKTLIIYKSIHHGNTLKIAKVIAKELDADIVDPSKFNITDFQKYDIIGFGSGIYNGEHHRSLFEFLKNIPLQKGKKAFLFSTATLCYAKMQEPFKKELLKKWFSLIGEFMCKGFIDYGFLKYFFGGLNKGRPNQSDLYNARKFAISLVK